MNCPLCNAPNPDTDRYCGQCAAPLDPANQTLRQQIVTVIGQEFKDQDLVAASLCERVATKVENRIWVWTKILGSAVAILCVTLTIFGIRSFTDALNKINDASQAATKASAEAVIAVNTASQNAISQMGQQSGSVSSKAKASNLELDKDKEQISSLKAGLEGATADLEFARRQLRALNEARELHPNTPIGQFDRKLFIDVPGSGPDKIAPYGLGDTRKGVRRIQARLAELGCYKRQPSGTFDQQTADAVIAFVKVNASLRPSPSDHPPSNGEMPSPTIPHAVPGEVDYHRWTQLFAQAAAKCPE